MYSSDTVATSSAQSPLKKMKLTPSGKQTILLILHIPEVKFNKHKI